MKSVHVNLVMMSWWNIISTLKRKEALYCTAKVSDGCGWGNTEENPNAGNRVQGFIDKTYIGLLAVWTEITEESMGIKGAGRQRDKYRFRVRFGFQDLGYRQQSSGLRGWKATTWSNTDNLVGNEWKRTSKYTAGLTRESGNSAKWKGVRWLGRGRVWGHLADGRRLAMQWPGEVIMWRKGGAERQNWKTRTEADSEKRPYVW